MFLPRSLVKIPYCGKPPWPRGSELGLRPIGIEFRILCLEAVSSHSSHHHHEVLLAHFSLYVHKGGLKPHSFISFRYTPYWPICSMLRSMCVRPTYCPSILPPNLNNNWMTAVSRHVTGWATLRLVGGGIPDLDRMLLTVWSDSDQCWPVRRHLLWWSLHVDKIMNDLSLCSRNEWLTAPRDMLLWQRVVVDTTDIITLSPPPPTPNPISTVSFSCNPLHAKCLQNSMIDDFFTYLAHYHLQSTHGRLTYAVLESVEQNI